LGKQVGTSIYVSYFLGSSPKEKREGLDV